MFKTIKNLINWLISVVAENAESIIKKMSLFDNKW